MESIVTESLHHLYQRIEEESPHLSHKIQEIYSCLQEGSIPDDVAITWTFEEFSPASFEFHPTVRRAYAEFCQAFPDHADKTKLIPEECGHPEIVSIMCGDKPPLTVDKATQYLEWGHEKQVSCVVRYCADWLMCALSRNIILNQEEHRVLFHKSDYIQDLYERVSQKGEEVTYDQVMHLLKLVCHQGINPKMSFVLQYPGFGSAKATLEKAVLAWLENFDAVNLTQILKLAVKLRCDAMVCAAVKMFGTCKTQREMRDIWRFGKTHRLWLVLLACLDTICRHSIEDKPFDCRGNEELSKAIRIYRDYRLKLEMHSVSGSISLVVWGMKKWGELKSLSIFTSSADWHPPRVKLFLEVRDVRPFLEENSPWIRQLVLSDSFRYFPRSLVEVLEEIKTYPSIEEVEITSELDWYRYNTEHNERNEKVISSVLQNRFIKRLELEVHPPYIALFNTLLNENSTLQSLTLTLKNDTESVVDVLKALKNHPSLRHVKLKSRISSFSIDVDTINAVKNIFKNNTSLRSFDIFRFAVAMSHTQTLEILSALKENSTLEFLEGVRMGWHKPETKKFLKQFHRVL